MTEIARTTGRLHRGPDTLWYETIGAGPALVFCHGLGGNAAIWYQQVPHFAQHYRVVLWDQRGFGRSSDTGDQTGPATARDDLAALLDHLEIERAHLVGQSMGGWAAMGLALQAPERVVSLVFSATTAGAPVQTGAVGRGSDRPASPTPSLGQHPALTETLRHTDPPSAYLYQALGSFGHRRSDADISARLRDTVYPAGEIAALDRPALFLTGELDRVIPAGLVRAAAAQVPGAQVTCWPDSGHSAYFEQPDRWNAAVDEFLNLQT